MYYFRKLGIINGILRHRRPGRICRSQRRKDLNRNSDSYGNGGLYANCRGNSGAMTSSAATAFAKRNGYGGGANGIAHFRALEGKAPRFSIFAKM